MDPTGGLGINARISKAKVCGIGISCVLCVGAITGTIGTAEYTLGLLLLGGLGGFVLGKDDQ